MIKDEYLRFLNTLNAPDVSPNVRKIANLVLTNIDQLIPLGTHQGQRVRYLVSLAQEHWDSVPDTIPPVPQQTTLPESQFKTLTSLTVGPFRGFARQEFFDLNSSLVLVYGPNGTGKSSFCEALEYGLLGNVAEAESRRFRDQNAYLKNAYVDSFTAPILTGIDKNGTELKIEPNETVYRFCFVEKNRIDNFSRIAAQAPAKQAELISTLFGLEYFNDFVKNFTSEIDSRYIDLIGIKSKELEEKQKSISVAKQKIKENTEELEKIQLEEQRLATKYKEGYDFDKLFFEINGDDTNPGLIETLQNELQSTPPNKSNLRKADLENLYQTISNHTETLSLKQKHLEKLSDQISYKALYEAVLQLQSNTPNRCPACDTPITHAAQDPYSKATSELDQLKYLASLQEEVKAQQGLLDKSLHSVYQIITTCLNLYPKENMLSQFQPTDQIDLNWWNQLHAPHESQYTAWDHLTAQVQDAERNDIEADRVITERTEKQRRLDLLRQFSTEINKLKTCREVAQRAIDDATATINQFEQENAQLIRETQEEKSTIQKNQTISNAYKSFVKAIVTYKDKLPEQLVSDLGKTTVDLYNSFNRNDTPKELLADVKLPITQNQRLEISFDDGTNNYYDALHILSEGHIRCIGLAILLAKNIKESSPCLIFDDPVNAIDEDHKEAIRKTLFDDQYFISKQILLTTHGEEFFKDIHNLLSAQSASHAHSFTFLPKQDDLHIQVDFNCSSRNYIISAREHLDRNELRYALSKSRQALESLTKTKIWKYVHKHGDGVLSLRLPSPQAPIELRNLTEALKSRIGKGNFGDPDKSLVYDPLDTLLGFDGNSREWRYLNKGTHDENNMPEFDRGTVSTIVSALEQLDRAL